jgi:hypothetical protein
MPSPELARTFIKNAPIPAALPKPFDARRGRFEITHF